MAVRALLQRPGVDIQNASGREDDGTFFLGYAWRDLTTAVCRCRTTLVAAGGIIG